MSRFKFTDTQVKYLTGRSVNTLTSLLIRDSDGSRHGFLIGEHFIETAKAIKNVSDYPDASQPIHGYLFKGAFYQSPARDDREMSGILYTVKGTGEPLFYQYYTLFLGLQQQQLKNSKKYAVEVAESEKQTVIMINQDEHNPSDYVWSYVVPSNSKAMKGEVKNYTPKIQLRHAHHKGRYSCNCTNSGIVNNVFPDVIVPCAHLQAILAFISPDLSQMIANQKPDLDISNGVNLRILEKFAQSLR